MGQYFFNTFSEFVGPWLMQTLAASARPEMFVTVFRRWHVYDCCLLAVRSENSICVFSVSLRT